MHKRMIKRRLLSVAAALVFLLAVSGCSAEEKGSVYMKINPKKAKEMMENSEEFVLLDVRSEEEFSEGHIPGAMVIPHEEILKRAEALT